VKCCMKLLLFAAGFGLLALPSIAASSPESLTLQQAREIALQTHPRITVAELRALTARKAVAESQAGLFPNLSANVGVAGAGENNTRIASGNLTVSSVFDRASAGLTLSQLVTDFGRTANLTEGTRLHAQAEEQRVQVTRSQLVLEVDAAYYRALQAQSILQVAAQTIATRQLLRDQVRTLATNELKSALDLRFAEVSFQEARLLQARAVNEVEAAFTVLSALLGRRDSGTWQLAAEPLPAIIGTNISELTFMALANRPELRRQRLDRDSLFKLALAEKGQQYPTVSILASAGIMPVRDPALNPNYAAAGVVLNVPLYAGGLYTARQDQAMLRARTADAALTEEENNVIRDVRIAWLNARDAWERLDITSQLLEQARASFALADARYKAGTSSMVELSQAQLSQTSAEITHASARFEYFLRRSVLDYQTGSTPWEPTVLRSKIQP
jgi:outer membrane protein